MLVNGTLIPDNKKNDVPEITAQLPAENIANDVDENLTWQSRFVKHGNLGQPLADQSSKSWDCISDLEYKSVLPNTQILWQRISKDAPLRNYAQATEHAKQVNQAAICGQTNWRLPTETELKSLLVSTPAFGAPSLRAGYVTTVLDDTVVGDLMAGIDSYYWTSTIGSYFPDTKHGAVSFQDMFSASSQVANTSMHRVRLISTSRLQP